jgi:hypothetical protein
MRDEKRNDHATTKRSEKKRYLAPGIFEYGDVLHLTRSLEG